MAEHRAIQQQLTTDRAPSKSQVIAVVTLLPVGGTLLLLSGLSLVGTLIGLAVTAPLFVIFSPVLVPAALVIGLAVTGFITSGAFGVTALSSFSYMARFLKTALAPARMDLAKRRAQEAASQLGQKTKETGQTIQSKAQETAK